MGQFILNFILLSVLSFFAYAEDAVSESTNSQTKVETVELKVENTATESSAIKPFKNTSKTSEENNLEKTSDAENVASESTNSQIKETSETVNLKTENVAVESSKGTSKTSEENNSEGVSEQVVTIKEDSQDSASQKDQEMLLEIKSLIPVYRYSPSEKEDPFSPPGQIGMVDLETKEKDVLHPVERDNLENIQLRAIIWGQNDEVVPRALFETTDQQTYTLTKNDRLGKERALIFKIETDRVWIMKPFVDPGTGVIGYEPDQKVLGDSNQQQQQKGGNLYYEK